MTTFDRVRLLQPLLDALETERHCRAPLLRSMIHELDDLGPSLVAARACAHTMLSELERRPMSDDLYRQGIASTRRLVERATQPIQRNVA